MQEHPRSIGSAPKSWIALLAGLLSLVAWSSPASAGADIRHIVQPGQNLSSIAKRYHTSADAIVSKNKLRKGALLRVGQRLVVAESAEHKKWLAYLESKKPKRAPKPEAKPDKPAASARAPAKRAENVRTPWWRAGHKSGFVRIVRNHDKFVGQLIDDKGRVNDKASQRIDKILRSKRTGEKAEIDHGLLALVAKASDAFYGRSIIVVSGYRPTSTNRYAKNSRHNHGKAIDFRVVGVPHTDVFAFCNEQPGVGCGYYPNSGFVHMDVRKHKTKWTDYSLPGQAPIYAHGGSKPPAPESKPATAQKKKRRKTGHKRSAAKL
jgi:uncharacterized protein YcbK (DUF882 family)